LTDFNLATYLTYRLARTRAEPFVCQARWMDNGDDTGIGAPVDFSDPPPPLIGSGCLLYRIEILLMHSWGMVKNGAKTKEKYDRRRPNGPMFVLISPPIFEVQGFKISKKRTPPTPNFGETRFLGIKKKQKKT